MITTEAENSRHLINGSVHQFSYNDISFGEEQRRYRQMRQIILKYLLTIKRRSYRHTATWKGLIFGNFSRPPNFRTDLVNLADRWASLISLSKVNTDEILGICGEPSETTLRLVPPTSDNTQPPTLHPIVCVSLWRSGKGGYFRREQHENRNNYAPTAGKTKPNMKTA